MKRAVALVLVFSSAACTSPAKTETQQLAIAVDRFRKAQNSEKPSHVDAIRRSPCTDAEVCAAKAVCLESAEATAKGITLTVEAGSLMKTLMQAGPGADTKPIERMLDDAKESNELGMKKLGECDDALMALKRKHGV